MRMIFAATVAAAVSVTGAHAASWSDAFTSFISFGDSLTDDGKFGSLAPPSLGGRFSNGITYAEHLAGDFEAQGKFTENFALGGATAEIDNETSYPPDPRITAISTFAGQIATFDALQPLLPTGDNPLVSVLFGANDIFQDLGEGAVIGDIGRAAADAVIGGITAISLVADKYDDFLVIDLPDLSVLPRYADNLSEAFEAGEEALAFNARLDEGVDALRLAGLNIIEVSLFDFLNGILADPGALGITNTADACTPSFTELTFAGNCSFTGAGFDITLADAFLFADQSHPNRVAHAAFADAIRAQIPLPATLPMMVAGLGLFGLVRRRA